MINWFKSIDDWRNEYHNVWAWMKKAMGIMNGWIDKHVYEWSKEWMNKAIYRMNG